MCGYECVSGVHACVGVGACVQVCMGHSGVCACIMVYYVHVCATAYRCACVRVIVSVPNVPANLPAL